MKFCNYFGQKGLCRTADLSHLTDDEGKEPDIIASVYTFLGRSAKGQLLLMLDDKPTTVYNRKMRGDSTEPMECGIMGNINYMFLGIYPSDSLKYTSTMKLDQLTSASFVSNGITTALHRKLNDQPNRCVLNNFPTATRRIYDLFESHKIKLVYNVNPTPYNNKKCVQQLEFLNSTFCNINKRKLNVTVEENTLEENKLEK